MSGELPIWCVCDHPTDYPEGYTARRHVVTPGEHRATVQVLYSASLADIREQLAAMGLTRIERDPEDDPVILESWL